MTPILEGVRVVDFGRYIAGPFCAAMLADLGAEVIRVEPPKGADDRWLMPLKPNGEGALYLQSNRGKQSLTLDTMKPEGRALMDRLISSADVVIANAPPKALKQMGLDFDRLKSIRPDVIFTMATAFDRTGPLANSSGFDGTGQAVSGAMYLSGTPGQPYRAATSYVDFSTAISCAYGTLAALIRKMKTGEGSLVEASLVNTALNMVTPILMEEATGARHRTPTANRSPIAGPSDLFATRDGWVLVQVIGRGMFRRWSELVGRPELADETRFGTDILRGDNGEELSVIMAEWCASRSVAECIASLSAARIPVTHLLRPSEVLDPANQLTSSLTWMRFPGFDTDLPVARPPAVVDKGDDTRVAPAPTLGQHSDAVLSGLGLDKKEIAALREQGIV